MHKDRLLKLADFLDTLPKERFDYTVWVHVANPDEVQLDGDTIDITEGCGTVGCAFGWATAIPEFQDLGLHLANVDGHRYPCVGKIRPWKFTPGNNLQDTVDAAERIFGVTEEEYETLFLSGTLSNPLPETASASEVAAHIRSFVDAHV